MLVKRLTVLVAMLAMVLVAAAPAMAQHPSGGKEISVTGVVQCAYPSSSNDGCEPGGWNIIDYDTGLGYVLLGDTDFGAYAGQYVTLHGFSGTSGNGDRTLDVLRIEPADQPGTPSPASYTVSFALAVKGQPPAGTTFFADGIVDPRLADASSTVQLTDPDGDGVYTGSTVAPPGDYHLRFTQGVSTVKCSQSFGGTCPGEPVSVVKDFGTVSVGQDTTYSAGASFDDQVTPKEGTTSPGPSTGEVTNPVTDQYSGGNTSGGTTVGEGTTTGGAAPSPSGNQGILADVLPDTGGVSLGLLGLAAVLTAAGALLARRIFR